MITDGLHRLQIWDAAVWSADAPQATKGAQSAPCHTRFNKLQLQLPLNWLTPILLCQTSLPSPTCLKRPRRASR